MLKLHVNFTCTSDASLNMILSVYTCVSQLVRSLGLLPARLDRSVSTNRDAAAVAMATLRSRTPPLSLRDDGQIFTHVCGGCGSCYFNSLFEGQTSSKIKGAENRKLTSNRGGGDNKRRFRTSAFVPVWKPRQTSQRRYNNFRNIYKHKFLLYFPQSVLARYYRRRLKETVHPKMKTVIIYSKPVWMCLFWTQRKIFWRMRETEQYFSPTIEVNGAPKQPDYKLSSKHLPLCSEHIHTGLDLLEDE